MSSEPRTASGRWRGQQVHQPASCQDAERSGPDGRRPRPTATGSAVHAGRSAVPAPAAADQQALDVRAAALVEVTEPHANGYRDDATACLLLLSDR